MDPSREEGEGGREGGREGGSEEGGREGGSEGVRREGGRARSIMTSDTSGKNLLQTSN